MQFLQQGRWLIAIVPVVFYCDVVSALGAGGLRGAGSYLGPAFSSWK